MQVPKTAYSALLSLVMSAPLVAEPLPIVQKSQTATREEMAHLYDLLMDEHSSASPHSYLQISHEDVLEQIVQFDLNGNGCYEVFLFYTPDFASTMFGSFLKIQKDNVKMAVFNRDDDHLINLYGQDILFRPGSDDDHVFHQSQSLDDLMLDMGECGSKKEIDL